MGMNSYHGAAVREERLEHEHFDATRSNDNNHAKQGRGTPVVSSNSWYHEVAVKEVLKQSRPHAS